ncbi:putative Ras-related protein Rab-7L1 [Hypsibius exemplaris]|uniref:Ras-related protein Rab-7L1 n=1 Tax=Hypsibius exemplaris TaxID=2072580 RepID=A0A1W0XA92_HYPEX|nr:putative Ras-related protein Rab-7L1 [Hypsibius exemplaris]
MNDTVHESSLTAGPTLKSRIFSSGSRFPTPHLVATTSGSAVSDETPTPIASTSVPVAPFRSKTYGSQRSRTQKRFVERALAQDSGRDVVTLKVLVIGDPSVGKTALINQFVGGQFLENYRQTIGVDFFHKMVRLKSGQLVRLQLWDIAGQERQRKLFRVYYRDADGCLLVFDLTNPASFAHIQEWKEELDRQCTTPLGDPIPCLLLGNKTDALAVDGPRHATQVEKLLQSESFVGFRQVSAREGTNVTDSIEYLTEVMVSNKTLVHRTPSRNSSFSRMFLNPDSDPFDGSTINLIGDGRHVVEEIHETNSCCI